MRPQEEALDAAAHPEHAKKHSANSLLHAVRLIIVADVIMSLDNVIAIAGIAKEGSESAHGEMSLVIFGLLLSIPLVVFGSALISRLMNHYRWVIWLGGGVLGHVAGEIIFKDPQVLRWLGVPAVNGMPQAQINRLVEAAGPIAHGFVHVLPWVLGVILFCLGAWWSWSRPSHGAAEKERTAA